MAGSPKFKLYCDKEYVGCLKYGEDAAAMVSILGNGAVVKYDHALIVWTEGAEEFSAGESCYRAAAVMEERRRKNAEAAYIKAYGKLPDDYKPA